ncbi:MAG TPA: hypothetical protein V6C65_10850, partial [Allocoleopsis sp.]
MSFQFWNQFWNQVRKIRHVFWFHPSPWVCSMDLYNPSIATFLPVSQTLPPQAPSQTPQAEAPQAQDIQALFNRIAPA